MSDDEASQSLTDGSRDTNFPKQKSASPSTTSAPSMARRRAGQSQSLPFTYPLQAPRPSSTDISKQYSRKKMTFSARPSEAMIKQHRSSSSTNAKDPSTAPETGTIWVEFNADTSVGIKQMRAFAHHIHESKFAAGILVTQVPVTAAALKIIPTVLPAVLETFTESDLQVNITHHELVPKHVLLSEEEKAALLKRYRLKDTQLPRIQMADPVSRYLGLRRGQVVKIIRRSETAGRYASYRLAY